MIEKGDTIVSLSWTKPDFDGGYPIKDYLIIYSVTDSGNWQVFDDGVSNTLSTIVTGLTNGENYEFQVFSITDFVDETSEFFQSSASNSDDPEIITPTPNS